ncbi:Myosin-9 like [Actinidia chinensis var. chinensis]|uniref:Myosin-9 like n=1 Tax=Actinidia chinensis var. chinensis TaxID=1590841 RepID=A0A2R6PHI7_ACTCC|nr:Myosin-9 like [Actinidia chinensis var. chinensis]
MDRTSHLPLPGSRQSNLKMSFKMGSRSLLTTCSKEEFSKAFATFTNAEQEALHRLFIQVITSLHEDIEDEFESVCLETQAGTILDTVEELVEEQNLDPLHSDKTDVGEVWHNLSTAKKNEIQQLMGILQTAEEQKRVMRARVDQLKKELQDVSGAADVSEKTRTGDSNYGTSDNS